MQEFNKKNFLINAKSKAYQLQYSNLIIRSQQNSLLTPKQIYEVLVSQYATIMMENMAYLFNPNQKYPLPLAYMMHQKANSQQKYTQSANILQYIQKCYQINNYIILLNIALIYKILNQTRKSLFYLQMSLKQNAFFQDTIYQYCQQLIIEKKKLEALKILYRHLSNKFQNREKIQSLYISIVSTESQSQQRQLMNLFHKKKISIIVAFNLGIFLIKIHNYGKALQLFQQLEQYLSKLCQSHYQQQNNYYLKDKKILTMVRINILQLINGNMHYIIQFRQLKKQISKYVDFNHSIKLKKYQNIQSYLANSNKVKQNIINLKKQKNITKTQQKNLYDSCRQLNRKKLQFLIGKERKVKKIFNQIKIYKNGQNIKQLINDNQMIKNAKQQINDSNYLQFQTKFQQKIKIYQLHHNHLNLQDLISQYFSKNQNSNNLNFKTHSKNKTTVIKRFRIKQQNKNNQLLKKRISVGNNNQDLKNQALSLIKNSFINDLSLPFKEKIQKNNKLQLTQFQKNLKIADELQNKNELKSAYELYLKMYKEFKKTQEKQQILLKIANIFEKQLKYQEAEKTYLKCCKYDNVKAFTKLGQLQLSLGRIYEGIQNLQKANCLKRFDLQIQVKLLYGYSLLSQNMGKALLLAHSILKRNPQSIHTLLLTINIFKKQGKIKQALKIAHAIEDLSQTPQMKHYIGLLYLTDSKVQQAYQYFQKAIQIQPDFPPSLIQIATILTEIKPNESINILKKVLEHEPQNILAHTRLAKIYESISGDYENAMISYEKTLQIRQNYDTYVRIGDILKKKQFYLQAYVNYKKALNLKNTHEIHKKIAQISQYQKEYGKSYTEYQLALQLLGDQNYQQRNYILLKMGKVAFLKKDYQNSANAYLKALEIQQSSTVFQELGDALYLKGQYSEALAKYQKSLKLIGNDNNTQILEKIAMCFDRKQEYLASKQIYQTILKYNPEKQRCMNNLANILLIIGKTNQAFYWLEHMLLKYPHNIQKRLKVADLYFSIGDWNKTEDHLLICYKQKQNDIKIIEKLINLYKQKRQQKVVNRLQKKLMILRVNKK